MEVREDPRMRWGVGKFVQHDGNVASIIIQECGAGTMVVVVVYMPEEGKEL